MYQHSLMVDNSNGFVCISDITNLFTDHNKVLYNPNLLLPIRKEMLQKITFEFFHFTFTNEQLDHLCQYIHTQCEEFIEEFKRLKKEIKKEDW